MFAKTYPSVVEFEVGADVVVAGSVNHDRDNPLALALTDCLGTRYLVLVNVSNCLIAQPYDDQDPELAAGEDAPYYYLDADARAFYDAFNAGSHEIVDFHDTWFTGKRNPKIP